MYYFHAKIQNKVGMFLNRPFFKSNSLAFQLVGLSFIVVICTMLILIIGIVLLAIPYGGQVIEALSNGVNTSSSFNINIAKYIQILSQLGMFIIPSLLFAFLFSSNTRNYLLIKSKIDIRLIILSIFGMLCAIPLINLLADLNSRMQLPEFMKGVELWMRNSEESAEIITKAFLDVDSYIGLFVNIVMIGVLPAIGEEFLFRGILIRLFNQKIKNIHFTIILTSILFSAFHLQFYGFLPRFLLGVYFGYLFYFSSNLWIPIIMHFVNNTLAVVLSYLINRGFISNEVETIGSRGGEAVYVMVSFILLFILTFVFYRIQKDKPKELANNILYANEGINY